MSRKGSKAAAASKKRVKPASARRVTLIPGDGVGPEVIAAAVAVIEASGVTIDWDRQEAGAAAFKRYGTPVPEPTLRSLRRTRIALKGPLETQVAEGWRSINVYLRRTFDLYANIRPTMSFAGVPTPFRDVNLVVVRENTEDLYSGIEHEIAPGVVEGVKVITARASRRIAKFAFEYARAHRRKSITAIHKANIMKLSDGLFLKCARAVARGYPEIRYTEQIVDAACMRLVTDPGSFDILLLENLYGDIVSDLCAGLVGGLGLVPGANYGDKGAIFEAVHGTAPDIAGKNVANPTAAILSAAMMLDYLGYQREGDRIRAATGAVLRAGKVLTREVGGKASTGEFTDAIITALSRA
ncbi:MAG: isocitrate/isopropylmalate family dehydrogenase [Candidatus Binatus sp.]|uniref:isocitrate/isopropylmalate dehydrogenase family protein n=1 Tax=Candidatus Binatus sp. TaxID=2811406 RepID=UPI0027217ECE|nr:isocitrate/isopropylmalate family dehydrogenase [Candidatus Binatus sp.]MDO8434264.1 isocitrate/isopropylmalate family dehydrogenase [Candidatus Binatus sp.]